MRILRGAAWGVLVVLACARWSTAAVPIDRPSPPPYCADGKCYPKYETWGHYEGRWRSWPGVDTRPGPKVPEPTPAERLGPDLKPYETPAPQDEDMRAPPPTPSQEQEMEENLGVQPEGAVPEEGAPEGSGLPPTGPPGPGLQPTAPEESESALPRVTMPIPSGRAPPGAIEEDADFPPPVPFNSNPSPINSPGLPFGAPTPDALPGNVPGDLPIPPDRAEIRRGRLASPGNDDPPPPLPAALGGLASL